MTTSDDMRRLIELANGNGSKNPFEKVEETVSPFKSFGQWGLNEAWGGEPASDSISVWQDPDINQIPRKWFWICSINGHITARGSEYTEEDAYTTARAHAAPGSIEEGEEHVMHLLRPMGGSECGAACGEDNCSPEINDITYPDCIEGHEAHMEYHYDQNYEGNEVLDENENHLDRMFTKYNAGHDDYFAQYDMFKGVNEEDDETLDEPNHSALIRDLNSAVTQWDIKQSKRRDYNHYALGIYLGKVEDIVEKVKAGMDWKEAISTSTNDRLRDFVISFMEKRGHISDYLEEKKTGPEVDIITGPAVWMSYLINGDSSGLDDEEIAACDAWQEKIAPWYVVSTDGEEPHFTWSYALHGGTAAGGDVVEYVCHKESQEDLDAIMEPDEPEIEEGIASGDHKYSNTDKIAFYSGEQAREAKDAEQNQHPSWSFTVSWSDEGQCWVVAAYDEDGMFMGYVAAPDGLNEDDEHNTPTAISSANNEKEDFLKRHGVSQEDANADPAHWNRLWKASDEYRKLTLSK